MSLNYKVIGKHIREVRQRNHLSQAMLSELVDKTPSYISYIDVYKRQMYMKIGVERHPLCWGGCAAASSADRKPFPLSMIQPCLLYTSRCV